MKYGENSIIIGLRNILNLCFLKISILGILTIKMCILTFVLFITNITSFWTSHLLHRRKMLFIVEKIKQKE